MASNCDVLVPVVIHLHVLVSVFDVDRSQAGVAENRPHEVEPQVAGSRALHGSIGRVYLVSRPLLVGPHQVVLGHNSWIDAGGADDPSHLGIPLLPLGIGHILASMHASASILQMPRFGGSRHAFNACLLLGCQLRLFLQVGRHLRGVFRCFVLRSLRAGFRGKAFNNGRGTRSIITHILSFSGKKLICR